jgi:hypothetical protein
MRNRNTVLAVLASLVVAALFALLTRKPEAASDAAAGADDYDYAAAFESLDPGSDAPLFRIADIAGRSEAEVAARLGPPWDCEASRYSRRCRYAPGATEIVYIDGRADWLTVRALGEAALDDEVLKRIGLLPKPAGTVVEDERVWSDLAGLREVRAVGHGGRAEFLRIKVKS